MIRFLVRRIMPGHPGHVAGDRLRVRHVLCRPGPDAVARAIAGKAADAPDGRGGFAPAAAQPSDFVQYGHYLWHLLQGNLGYSFYNSESVSSSSRRRFPVALSLVLGAAILFRLSWACWQLLSAVRARSLDGPELRRPGAVLLLDAVIRPRPAAPARLLLRVHLAASGCSRGRVTRPSRRTRASGGAASCCPG